MENLVSRQANVTYSDNFPAIATLRTTDNIRRVSTYIQFFLLRNCNNIK